MRLTSNPGSRRQRSMRESLASPEFLISDFAKMDRQLQVFSRPLVSYSETGIPYPSYRVSTVMAAAGSKIRFGKCGQRTP